MIAGNIENIDNEIRKIPKYVKTQISHPEYPRIMLIGVTNAGKSSLMCALANKDLTIVRKTGNAIQLDGEGIFFGSKSGTRIPGIYTDDQNELILCDCPGFMDTEGSGREIINSFADDCLLIPDGYEIKVKILLVISVSDIETSRGNIILETILRVEKMLSEINQLDSAIGLVITKGEENVHGLNYIEYLNENAKPELKGWIDFFQMRKNQVFTFPRASPTKVGEKYTFKDHRKLMSFIKKDYLINPKHNVTISQNALSELNMVITIQLEEIKDIIRELFAKINNQYRQKCDTATISLWLNIMKKLICAPILKVSDIKNTLKDNLPNNDQFYEYYAMFDEFNTFESFISRIPDADDQSSNLKIFFLNYAKLAIDELEKTQTRAQEYEKVQAINVRNERVITSLQNDLYYQNNQIRQLSTDIQNQRYNNEQNKQRNKQTIDQLKNEIYRQQCEFESQKNRIIQQTKEKKDSYDNDIYSLQRQIDNIKKQINDEKTQYEQQVQVLQGIISNKERQIQDLQRRCHSDSDSCLLI